MKLKKKKLKVKLIWEGDNAKESPDEPQEFGQPEVVEVASIANLPLLAEEAKRESDARLSIAKKLKKSFFIKTIITK